MNPRERVLNILERKPVDRIPVDIWHTPEVEEALRKYTGTTDNFEMWRSLGVDKIVWDFLDYKTPEGKSAGSQPGADASASRTDPSTSPRRTWARGPQGASIPLAHRKGTSPTGRPI